MLYIVTAIILLASLYAYFPIARKYRILAGVNNRSSHKHPVITAAGFIFFLTYIIYVVYMVFTEGLSSVQWYWFAGMTLLAIVSFIDDLRDVWFLFRLFAQFIGAALMLWQLSLNCSIEMVASVSQWSAAILLLVIAVGLFNLYNFMDGLNGMLGGISLAIAIPLLLIDIYVDNVSGFVDYRLIVLTVLASLIFMFFNFRGEPKCFSGDVGSIVLGYMMTYFVISLVIKSGNVAYFLLFAVTFVEAGLTVTQRLFAGDNIFAPHRMHLFQLYCNEFYKSHMLVSGIYSGIQLAFGMALFVMNYYGMSVLVQNCILWPLFGLLCFIYLVLKRRKMGGHLLGYRIEKSKNEKI